jgi:hypothetical protein
VASSFFEHKSGIWEKHRNLIVTAIWPHGYMKPLTRAMPITPITIQKQFSNVYALSLFSTEHQESRIASDVLTTQTNRKGLLGPNQLTRVKLKIRIATPTISTVAICFFIRSLILKKEIGSFSDRAIQNLRLGKAVDRVGECQAVTQKFLT